MTNRQKSKDLKKKMAKEVIKRKVVAKITAVLLPIFIKILIICLVIGVLYIFFNVIKEQIYAKNTYKKVYEIVGGENLKDLVEIKGNDEDGYYWGFVKDFDDKLDKILTETERNPNTEIFKDKYLLKKMILAQVVTEFPDLGKNFPNKLSGTYSGTSKQKAEQILKELSLEDKISQMLFVLVSNNNELSQNAGGYVLEDGFDFTRTKDSINTSNNNINPIFAVDEEGGTVQRVFNSYPSAREYGNNGDYNKIHDDFAKKAIDLMELGINMNLAPVADVTLDKNENNEKYFMTNRSFSGDYEIASKCIEQAVKGMKENGMITTLKHFPGYANAEDTHISEYVDKRKLEDINKDIEVFKRGIEAGAATVMTSHITVEAIDSANPTSLSSKVIGKIRELGFDGVIISDALNMGAMKGHNKIYEKAVKAGNDILEVTNYSDAKREILDAVRNGSISESKIDESVLRILTMKLDYNIIDLNNIITDENENNYEVSVDKNDVNKFQGALHLRRIMPNKKIGELKDVSSGVEVEKIKHVSTSNYGLGTKEDIPENIKKNMEGVSMNGISGTSYDDLSYLTIYYYDFNDKKQVGNMVVNKKLADEVLLIFQELFREHYPIKMMKPVESIKNMDKKVIFGEGEEEVLGTKLDTISMWNNNTSSFNDRNTSDGKPSNHALGCAIDINPLINPYVENGEYSPLNAEKYVDRTMRGWSEIEKKAIITKDSKIYNIFKKYDWTWGGDWDGKKDYQHFEKTDLSQTSKIVSINPEKKEEDKDKDKDKENKGDGNIAGDGKHYVVAIDAGHGIPQYANQGWYKPGTEDTSGLNTGMVEWECTRKVADAVRDKLSIYSNLEIVRIGNSDENPGLRNSERVSMAKKHNADLYITIHYNSSVSKSANGTMVYYPQEINLPEDTSSKVLAEVLSNSVSTSLGLKNGGVQSDLEALRTD